MDTPQLAFTESDAQSLADKLAEFDASLTPAERAIFRARVVATMPDTDDDVVGHRMEMRWSSGPGGIFQAWVHVEDGADSGTRGTHIDPNRWDTLSANTAERSSAPVTGKKAEGTA